MGQEVQRCIADSQDLILAGVWSRTDESDHLISVLSSADIAIDFTLPEATSTVIQAACKAKTPLVCGVSGLPEPVYQLMATAAKDIPILYDRNMSLGVAVLQQLVQMAGAALANQIESEQIESEHIGSDQFEGDQFEAEIHETHHIHKLDAPSGTALQLGEALAASRGQSFTEARHYDPCGKSHAAKGQIHFEVKRRGEVPGEHTVVFSSANESLSLEHKVTDRRVFAAGAIRATCWLVEQGPGLYGMQDVVKSGVGVKQSGVGVKYPVK